MLGRAARNLSTKERRTDPVHEKQTRTSMASSNKAKKKIKRCHDITIRRYGELMRRRWEEEAKREKDPRIREVRQKAAKKKDRQGKQCGG